jgi:hypothetical protein
LRDVFYSIASVVRIASWSISATDANGSDGEELRSSLKFSFMHALPRRISLWGLASLILFVGEIVVGSYDLYRRNHYGSPLFSYVTGLEICAAVQLAAAVCGIIAIKRGGSMWWMAVVLPAAFLALGCYFGEV